METVRGKIAKAAARWFSPFTGEVPGHVDDAVTMLQYKRLLSMMPVLCLTIAANAVAMAIAVMGDLPAWQQVLPPAILTISCIVLLLRQAVLRPTLDPVKAHKTLRNALFLAAPLGLVAGLWGVNAFVETEKYYCMVAPVFLALGGLVSALCLSPVPRAAIAAMVAAVAPLVIYMATFDYIGIRAMAIMLALIAVVQSTMLLSRFRETVRMLTLQHELNRQAQSDSLTGLDNRLAFMGKLASRLDAGAPVALALVDLNDFKLANDTYGHRAGDDVLRGVGERMTAMAQGALSVARLGGDEFALLFDGPVSGRTEREIEACRKAIALPFVASGAIITISASIGTAQSPAVGTSIAELMEKADLALYDEKRGRIAEDAEMASGRRRWRDG